MTTALPTFLFTAARVHLTGVGDMRKTRGRWWSWYAPIYYIPPLAFFTQLYYYLELNSPMHLYMPTL